MQHSHKQSLNPFSQTEADSLKTTIASLEQDLARSLSELGGKLSAEEAEGAKLRENICALEQTVSELQQQLEGCR
jgi:hypothetical protein